MSDGTITYPDPAVPWARDVRGLSARSVFTYTGPSSYAAGGTTLAPGAVKLGTIETIAPAYGISTTHAILFLYNKATGKIMAFWCAGAGAALVEVTDATDLSGYTAQMIAEGRG